jgi:CRISPR associated protein Cas1
LEPRLTANGVASPRSQSTECHAELLYALLESETRLAAAAMGLDPGIGLLHVDSQARDSLACDLMESVRPLVDAYVLDWITREPLRREWFFEQRNGNCRLMGSFAVRLSETAATWGRAVAPIAEWVARELWSTTKKPTSSLAPAIRLTQNHKRQPKVFRQTFRPQNHRSHLVSAWVAARQSSTARAFAHPVASLSREMNSLRVQSVVELLRRVPRLKLAGLKRSVAMLTLNLRGKTPVNRRSVTKSIAARFNRA